ncbi:MAG: DUF2550 domain-containing protein [Propionibacterium sp.]|nr:DUF2550 domain-containing protein [Actinomyces sp.]MDN6793532.1 DUF2550 domain-containing protein [Propionibacterium sp.]
MGTFLIVVVWVLAAILLASLGVWLYFNVRARRLDTHLGSFRCWARPDSQSGWTSGIAHYGVETLSWYRLVGFSARPVFILPRRGLEVSAPLTRAVDGSIVEVRVGSADQRWEFAIAPSTYTGLVSWVESGPPLDR